MHSDHRSFVLLYGQHQNSGHMLEGVDRTVECWVGTLWSKSLQSFLF